MTTMMKQTIQRYVAAIEVYEERVNAWATEKKHLMDEREKLKEQLMQAETRVDGLTATINERDEELRRYESYVAELQNVDANDL
jgi:chromosome segregation ATPase